MVNAAVGSGTHPPALQPRHRQLARLILHWRCRYPGLPVLLAKKDIKGAFRLLWLDPEDCELFAGEVPWKPEWTGDGEPGDQPGTALREEPAGGVLVVFLVLSFGFCGAPGE